ncbi:MAG: VWA domain-containing protein [Gammaproteobacteria bacterium]|nr:VWA domain-containing protein [Gammaproteobacteria bacterium]
MRSLRFVVWLALLALSIVIHGISASRVGSEIKQADAALAADEARSKSAARQVVIEIPPDAAKPREPEEIDLDEPLDFEEEFELDAPEVLIAPQAVAPPPPNVALSLKAQAGGAGEEINPVEIAVATPNVAGLVQRASIPTVGILAPTTVGGTSGGSGGGTAGFGVGIGNALGGSSNQFAAYIAGMRESGLDIVFVVDATGSMGWVIDEVKDRIRDISTVVRSLVPIARFGMVAYRDKDGPVFVTKVQPLTYSTLKMQVFLNQLTAEGGGDIYEAVLEGVKDGIDGSDWRLGARRIMILIGDAPPSDRQLDDIVRAVGRFSSSGGVVSTLDVSDQSNPSVVEAKVGRPINRAMYRSDAMPLFGIIAGAGNGDSATLEGEVSITRRLITLIMGDQYAQEMSALLELI